MPSWSLVQTLKFTAISNEYIFPNIHSLPSHFVKYFHQISSNNGPHELKHWGGEKLLGFAPFLWPLPPSPECSGSEAKACWERCRPTGWRRSSGCRGRCLVCGAAQWSRDAAGADSQWAAAAAACSGMMDRRDIIGRSHVFFLYIFICTEEDQQLSCRFHSCFHVACYLFFLRQKEFGLLLLE